MAENLRRRASARKRKRRLGELSLGPSQDIDHAHFVQQKNSHLHELRNFPLHFSEIQFRLVLSIKLEKIMEGRGADSRALDRHIRRGDASAQAKLSRAFLLIEAQLLPKTVHDAEQEHRGKEERLACASAGLHDHAKPPAMGQAIDDLGVDPPLGWWKAARNIILQGAEKSQTVFLPTNLICDTAAASALLHESLALTQLRSQLRDIHIRRQRLLRFLLPFAAVVQVADRPPLLLDHLDDLLGRLQC